ncbi:SET domain-containing protein-lysine N-methyltransferase [Ornithinibacillus halophilus]|uniref:SET domain-containing protein n=1 Tax=Ornithinibacillus halophilus TaxID=930117 RepID=A0A1M5IGY2_9BACI|nr:SET domain-containing protein [Ornithinibacillus halophilus]SHG27537.1 hypothetical protein SAMN05216225_102410 [Ornithinibacillus halophilus]
MIHVKTEVKQSKVHGEGLFLLEPVKKGDIIASLIVDAKIMTEEEYQEEQRKNNEIVVKTGVRFAGEYFLYKDTIDNEEYINHSNDPSMLYHCGICFAKRDLDAGDELTVDYKYFLARDDIFQFSDEDTSQKVDGMDPKKAMIDSAKELIELWK